MIYKSHLIKNAKLLEQLESIKDIDLYTLKAEGNKAVIAAFDPEKSRCYPATDLGPALEKTSLEIKGITWDTLQAFEVKAKAQRPAKTKKKETKHAE